MNAENDNLEAERPRQAAPHVWRRAISSVEGRILVAGVILVFAYGCAIVAVSLRSRFMAHALITMTGAHIIGGRAAGMSFGYSQQFAPWIVILANMVIETFLLLLFYPLFVFSYQRLIVIKPLKHTMQRTQRTAAALQPRIMKYGIPGLLLFVWFPFWMTGPLVGAVIGFLIGLRPIVNLGVVLAGTYMAILCWGVVLDRLYQRLAHIGPYVPFAIVAVVLLCAVAIRIRYAFARHGEERSERAENSPEEKQADEEPTGV